MKKKPTGIREAAVLAGVCLAALLPVAYIVRRNSAAPVVSSPTGKPKTLWDKSRFFPTTFEVGQMEAIGDLVVLTNDNDPSLPIIVGTLSDGRLVSRLKVPRPAGSTVFILTLTDDRKEVWMVWMNEARTRTHIESWDWRKGRRLHHVSFPFHPWDGTIFPKHIYLVGRTSGEGAQNILAVFSTKTGKQISAFRYSATHDTEQAVTDDERGVAILVKDRVHVFEGPHLKKPRSFKVPLQISDVSWAGNSRIEVRGPTSGAIHDAGTGRQLRQFRLGAAGRETETVPGGNGSLAVLHGCESYEWTGNGRFCFGLRNGADAAGTAEATIFAWRSDRTTPFAKFKVPGTYTYLFVPPGDKYLIAAGHNNKSTGIRIWDIATVTRGPRR